MKKILALLLCFVLAFSLVACGDKTAEEPTIEETQPEETKPKGENISKDPIDLPDWMGEQDDQDKTDEPVVEDPSSKLPQAIDVIMFGNKSLELSNITIKSLKDIGYEPKSGISVWMTHSDFMSLSGSGFKNANDQELVVCTPEDNANKLVGIVVDDEETPCVFYKGIKIGMSEEDCMTILEGLELDTTESFGTKKYATHNATNSLVVSIEDGKVVEIIVCVSKEARLNLSASSEADITMQDYLKYTYPQNDYTQWIGYGFTPNCTMDIKNIQLEGQKFDFTEMLARNLISMGYMPKGIFAAGWMTGTETGMIYSQTFVSEDNKTIYCVFDEEGKIEYMYIEGIETDSDSVFYDENAKQTAITIIKDITIGTEEKVVEKTFKDCANAKQTSSGDYIVKTDEMTLVISVSNGFVDGIAFVNNKLVW